MLSRARWGLMVMLAMGAAAGCSQSRQTVRGQSPVAMPGAPGCETQGPIIGTAPGYAEFVHGHRARNGHHDFKAHTGFRDNNFGYEGGYYAGPEGYYTERDRVYTAGDGTGCPACEYGQACPADGCPHCGHACGQKLAELLGHGPNGYPTHYQTYRYDWPQNMVYPPNQVPAGMVQYPYYTLRGPTDFFMK
jgi:hypothetical protein